MTPEQSAALREPFPPSQVGQLPKSGTMLDYVGHGAVTDRLLAVDPQWNWEPVATDEQGLPVFIYDDGLHPIALWINLTVCGVTRLGVGTCGPKQFDAEKVLIGDAIRNAAMRFGVALDLWIRGQAEDAEAFVAKDTREGGRRARKPRTIPVVEAKHRLLALAGGDEEAAVEAWRKAGLNGKSEITEAQYAKAEDELRQLGWSWHKPGQENAGDQDRAAAPASGPTSAPAATDPDGGTPQESPPSDTAATSGSVAPPEVHTVAQLAQRAALAFTAVTEAAPKGKKTAHLERMRHAAVSAATGGEHTSMKDLDAAGLADVWALLGDIIEGHLTFTFDMDDAKGVTFTDEDGASRTVLWAELEQAVAS